MKKYLASVVSVSILAVLAVSSGCSVSTDASHLGDPDTSCDSTSMDINFYITLGQVACAKAKIEKAGGKAEVAKA